MTAAEPFVRIGVLVGSRRPKRRGVAVAEWVTADPPAGIEFTILDLDEIALPSLAEPDPPMFGEYTLQHTRDWSRRVDGLDGYVLVTPEYNHSTSPALLNALDHVYHEWHDKAVAFAGYGTDGGVRAVEHLRGVTAELGLAGVGPAVALSIFDDFDAKGRCAPRPRQIEVRTRMLDGLARWARALRDLRAADGQPESATAGDDSDRPALNAPTPQAQDAIRELIEHLQTGLDRGEPDHYDAMFADDVLWGTPYGQVVGGFANLNTAHRSMMRAPAASPSRYELVQSVIPTPDVAVAQVRRRNLTKDDAAFGFSEMAMYVLIRRVGRWWLVGGQNTPIRPKP